MTAVGAVMIERWDGLCESGAWRKSWGQRRLRTFHTVRVAAARVVARGYESLDHSLAQSHRGALGLEARATSVSFSVDRLRHFLDLEQGCVVAGAPLVVHMKALCSCTPLTVSSPPTAF